MDGFHFFAEMPEARKSKSAGKRYPMQPWTRAYLKRAADEGKHINCVAVSTDRSTWRTDKGEVMKECISSLQDIENSPCCGSSASWSYLANRCTRVDEATARKLHPQLAAYLNRA